MEFNNDSVLPNPVRAFIQFTRLLCCILFARHSFLKLITLWNVLYYFWYVLIIIRLLLYHLNVHLNVKVDHDSLKFITLIFLWAISSIFRFYAWTMFTFYDSQIHIFNPGLFPDFYIHLQSHAVWRRGYILRSASLGNSFVVQTS